MIVFFPMSAIVTIFCYILLHPLHPEADQDLQLLESAPELIKSIRTRKLTYNEMLHVKMVDDFLEELKRLARCAVEKARQEQALAGQYAYF